MIKSINILLFFVYLTILVVNSQDIYVNYNVQKSYNTSDQCGEWNTPCVTLEDAGKKAILNSATATDSQINITIVGDIIGSSVSFGNLYEVCGTLQIRSYNNNPITIDGSNSNVPFVTIKENQVVRCSKKRILEIVYLNFINWNQTLLRINIDHQTNKTYIDPSNSLDATFDNVKLTSLNSIYDVVPKYDNNTFNPDSVIVTLRNVMAEKLKSTSSLTKFSYYYLAPISSESSTCKIFNLTLLDGEFSSTPFAYFHSSKINIEQLSISNNSFCTPFIYGIGLFGDIKNISLNNNKLSTILQQNLDFSSDKTSGLNINGMFINTTNDLYLDCSTHDHYMIGSYFVDSLFFIYDSENKSFEVSDIARADEKPITITTESCSNFNITSSTQTTTFDIKSFSSDIRLLFDINETNSTFSGSISTIYIQ
ncbi:hypothetical protein ACTA71_009057 [Dictyostelium dimigraforme]